MPCGHYCSRIVAWPVTGQRITRAESAEREVSQQNAAESLFYTQDWLDKLQGSYFLYWK